MWRWVPVPRHGTISSRGSSTRHIIKSAFPLPRRAKLAKLHDTSFAMGFSFRGLTSNALVSTGANDPVDTKDVADVPASVQGHTSLDVARPDEKLGTARTTTLPDNSDEELNQVDKAAEHGVQAVQAATQVWTKRDKIIAFVS